jgi:hypothetical protein
MIKKIRLRKIKFLLLLSPLFFSNLPNLEAMDLPEGISSTTVKKASPEDNRDRECSEKAEPSLVKSQHRLYVVVDEGLEKGLFANVIAHTAVGLGSTVGANLLEQLPYISQDDVVFNRISRHPFIVLKGKPNKLRELWKSLESAKDIEYVSFIDTMHLGPTAERQIEATRQRSVGDLRILGISLFGTIEKLAPLMKKFSVYK